MSTCGNFSPMNRTGLLNYQETAELLGVSAKTVRRLVDSGKLVSIRLSERIVRFDRADVEAFAERNRVEAS